VVITGRFSLRDDKDPQIVVNRARPMSDFANEKTEQPKEATLYLRLPTETDGLFEDVKAVIGRFPGDSPAVVYFVDTKQRRGTRCKMNERLLQELTAILGSENVVVK
jgi:DNA polymerase-3 subunit alpha